MGNGRFPCGNNRFGETPHLQLRERTINFCSHELGAIVPQDIIKVRETPMRNPRELYIKQPCGQSVNTGRQESFNLGNQGHSVGYQKGGAEPRLIQQARGARR